MTYFGFLTRFLVVPILLMLVVTWFDQRNHRPTPGFDNRRIPLGIGIHILLALVYTTPWDNYLVATGVWNYNPALVTGIVFGWVPLEEYTFFVLQTLLTGLIWWFLARRLAPVSDKMKSEIKTNSKSIRFTAFGILFAVWLVFAFLLFSKNQPMTYLSITLFWALPAIFPQMLFGADILWHHRRLVLLAIVPISTYLSLMDIFALRATTWAISPTQTTGLLFFDILPLEEVVFFFITNILIGFGMTLLLSNLGAERIAAWKARNFKGLP
jgi:lycopene cyclase domain-containing protein